jgi:hypothetical protein
MPPITSITKSRQTIESLLMLLIIAAAVLIGWLWKAPPAKPSQTVTIWLFNMSLLIAFTILAGHMITGLWHGVLIGSANKISLSRLQMLLWTILVLSGFLIAVLINLHRGVANPFSVEIDAQLWALIGISTASLVGSPLITNIKRSERRNVQAEEKTTEILKDQGVNTDHVQYVGKIQDNKEPEDASWTDIFKGEEAGNACYLDLAKIQMFFFTLITWSVYAVALGDRFIKGIGQGISAFPDVDGSMVALLGISHAGYLANKAVPHTPEPSPNA